jgi:hypothetical protein
MTTDEFAEGWRATAGSPWLVRVFWHWVWFTFSMGAPAVVDGKRRGKP